MSSLAFNAAPFDNEDTKEYKNDIEKKRQLRNKTIKRRTSPKEHVETMLKQINREGFSSDENSDMADFKPPPKPVSMGASRREMNDIESNNNSNSYVQESQNDDSIDVEHFQNLPSVVADDYYRQYVPYFDRINQTGSGLSKDELIQKLDYMIHLLEEQQETKTNTVTEEVILYSFLGVFVIFVLDSFARASKYVR
jgi:hypothetical protein